MRFGPWIRGSYVMRVIRGWLERTLGTARMNTEMVNAEMGMLNRTSFDLKTTLLASLAAVLLAAPAMAVPALQIGIDGGYYDFTTETIVTSADVFTVYAYATPNNQLTLDEILNDKFYLSIALTPQTADPVDVGSFTVDGSTINATGDMVYGTPPIETGNVTQEHDANDLSTHDVYETYFAEIKFMFDENLQSGVFNTQDNPDSGPIAGTGMYYVAFDIDKTLLDELSGLHFDLYNTEVKEYSKQGTDYVDVDRLLFAPFSHDGGTTVPVPEPTAALVFGLGALVVGARVGRRR